MHYAFQNFNQFVSERALYFTWRWAPSPPVSLMQGKLVWRLVLVRAPSALLRGTGPTSTPPSFIPPNSMGCRPADDIYKGQDPSNRPRRGRRANCYNGRIKLPGERERERERERKWLPIPRVPSWFNTRWSLDRAALALARRSAARDLGGELGAGGGGTGEGRCAGDTAEPPPPAWRGKLTK